MLDTLKDEDMNERVYVPSHSEALLLRLELGGESPGELVKMQFLFQESGVGLRLCSRAACGPQCE